MTTSPEKISSVDDNPQRLSELLSVSFDSELLPQEAAELAVLNQQNASVVRSISAGYSRVRHGLQLQPVKPVSGLLFRAGETLKPVPAPSAVDRRMSGRTVSVVAGVLSSCLLLMWVTVSLTGTLPFGQWAGLDNGRSSRQINPDANKVLAEVAETTSNIERRLEQIRAETPVIADPAEERSRDPSAMSSGRGARMSASVMPAAEVAGPLLPGKALPLTDRFAQTGAAELAEVRTLVDAAEWKVVVVKVGSHDRSEVVDKVGIVLGRHGLELEQSGSEAAAGWVGLVLTPRVGAHQTLIRDVEIAVGGAPVEWDPAEVLSSTREQIIAAVRQSLKSPTESELKRGEIFVAVKVPSKNVHTAGGKESGRHQKSFSAGDASTSVAGAKSDSSGVIGEHVAAGSVDSSRKSAGPRGDDLFRQSVTLVVFEFGNIEKTAPGGSGIRNVF